MQTAKISSKNQITIPKKVLESLDISPGDRLLLEVQEGKIILKPPPKIKHPTQMLYGSVKKKVDAVKAVREFRKAGGRS
ncbi:MAG TPA: AbrB/MazE/SpoVT family DNA-binding domain-containing protein [Nitrososphaerales archaeon]